MKASSRVGIKRVKQAIKEDRKMGKKVLDKKANQVSIKISDHEKSLANRNYDEKSYKNKSNFYRCNLISHADILVENKSLEKSLDEAKQRILDLEKSKSRWIASIPVICILFYGITLLIKHFVW